MSSCLRSRLKYGVANVERRPIERISIQAHVEELGRRVASAGRFQEGHPSYEEQLRIFVEYAEQRGLFLDRKPEEVSRPPDEEGNEHQVWFIGSAGLFVKVTWPDFFGLKVIYRSDEDERSSPIQYLERWDLHNRHFGDRVEFSGVLRTADGLRLVIQQPAVAGKPASVEQIESFFTSNGWRPFSVDGNLAFYDPVRKIAVSDTHPGNLVMMEDGLLAPIDLRVQALDDVLTDAVEGLCEEFDGDAG